MTVGLGNTRADAVKLPDGLPFFFYAYRPAQRRILDVDAIAALDQPCAIDGGGCAVQNLRALA